MGEVRKLGVDDLNFGYGTETSTGGVSVTKINSGSIPGLAINVKDADYGATGDGSTDDTTAIAAAIDAAEASGGTVFFPAGTYRVTDGFYVRGKVNLIGEGANTRIIQYGTSFSTSPVLFYYQSPTQTTYTSTGTISGGDTTMTLNSTSGLAVGDNIFLQLGTATYDYTQPYLCMFNRIASIAGSQITLSARVPEDISGTSHNVLLFSNIVEGVTISDLCLEADADAQPDQAMYIERCRNVTVRNVIMNHTGGLINAQSENVLFENIYCKRARFYGTYAASGRFINGWGFRNFHIKNVFGMDIDGTGIYFEAMGRMATVENYIYNAGAGVTTSGYGAYVTGGCKGIYFKNCHFNAPQANYYGISVIEESTVRSEDIFLYNGTTSEGFLKTHRGLLGWDGGTGTMSYYEKIKQFSIKIDLSNTMYNTYKLPGGIYKQVKAYCSDTTGVTHLYFMYNNGGYINSYDMVSDLSSGTLVDVSPLALVSLGLDSAYPFNNYDDKQLLLATTTVTGGAYIVVQIEYYAVDDDSAEGMIQVSY